MLVANVSKWQSFVSKTLKESINAPINPIAPTFKIYEI